MKDDDYNYKKYRLFMRQRKDNEKKRLWRDSLHRLDFWTSIKKWRMRWTARLRGVLLCSHMAEEGGKTP